MGGEMLIGRAGKSRASRELDAWRRHGQPERVRVCLPGYVMACRAVGRIEAGEMVCMVDDPRPVGVVLSSDEQGAWVRVYGGDWEQERSEWAVAAPGPASASGDTDGRG
jgi:hypothetical protein